MESNLRLESKGFVDILTSKTHVAQMTCLYRLDELGLGIHACNTRHSSSCCLVLS